MRYSSEPKDRRYIKGYGFLSFVKNIGKCISSKYSQKLVECVKKSATHAVKTASKRAIKKTAEAAGDLIDNKTSDKITSVSTDLHSKKFTKELHFSELSSNEIPKKSYITLQETRQVISELRLLKTQLLKVQILIKK